MIDRKHKFIFVHIPRTGGSSIEISLGRGLGTLKGNNTVIGTFQDKHWTCSNYKAENPSEWKSFFKFSFVRNPWDRAISTYEWLKMHKTHPHRTTDSFKKWLLSIKPNCNSYKTQSEYINETIDFVGRYENLHEDWAYVQGKIFPLGHKPAPLPHINKTKRHGDYHDKETIDFVSNYYREEIESYGYKSPEL
jgi:chondroitin 4-sulfotransferase 11